MCPNIRTHRFCSNCVERHFEDAYVKYFLQHAPQGLQGVEPSDFWLEKGGCPVCFNTCPCVACKRRAENKKKKAANPRQKRSRAKTKEGEKPAYDKEEQVFAETMQVEGRPLKEEEEEQREEKEGFNKEPLLKGDESLRGSASSGGDAEPYKEQPVPQASILYNEEYEVFSFIQDDEEEGAQEGKEGLGNGGR